MKKHGFHKLFFNLLLYKPWMFIISVLLNIIIFSYNGAMAYFVREILNLIEKASGFNAKGSINIMPGIRLLLIVILGIALIRIAAITACAAMDNIQVFHYENLLRNNIIKIVYKQDNIRNIAGKSDKAFEIVDDDVPACAFPSQLLSEVTGYVIYSLIVVSSLLIINWRITIYIFIPLSLSILIIQSASKRIKENHKDNREIHGKLSETISDIANLVQTIKISHSQDSILKHYEKLNRKRLDAVLKDTLFQSSMQGVINSTVYIGTAVMMLVAARSMMQGEFPIGDFSMFVFHLGTLASCVDRILELVSLSKQAEVSYDRITELVGEKNGNELTAKCGLRALGEMGIFQYECKERTPLKELEVMNLTYVHDDRNGIYDISFKLKPGEVLAVAGGIGSGKSTVLNCLMGIVPKDSGKIYWNGKEIEQTRDFFTPPNASYTPQIAKIFSGTIRENLLMGKPAVGREMSDALQSAVFEDDIAEMDNGLYTDAGSSGSRLSGGQMQRLALARMYLHDAELYLMDDSSSAIDAETEKELWDRFQKKIAGKEFAAIIATNKRYVLQCADKIIFMKNGRVVDSGKADELSVRCEEFARICMN